MIYFKWFFKFITIPFNLTIWNIVKLIPRNKEIIVYGSWFGEKVSDNSWFLFIYGSENYPNLQHYFITKDKTKVNGKNILHRNSLKAILKCLTANYSIISSGKRDLIPLAVNGSIIINVWHGSPIKKICQSDNKSFKPKFEKFKKRWLPHIYEYDFNYIISASKEFDEILMNAFNITNEQIIKSGFPRNNVYYSTQMSNVVRQIKLEFPNSKTLFYLPTFRTKYDFNPFDDFQFEFSAFNEFLIQNNFVFIYNFHFASKENNSIRNERILNVKDLGIDDISLLLNDIDLLITDYSSVIFDFLISRKPIILAPFDLDKYMKFERELNFNYNDFSNLPKVFNWSELMKVISKVEFNEKTNEKRYVSYSNKNSSRNIYNFLFKL